jgi:hypothetical protein
VPERLAGVDITETGDTRLIEEEIFQRAGRGGEQFSEMHGSEFARKSVSTERRESGALFGRVPCVDSAKVAAVGKAKDAVAQFECDIDVDAIFGLVGPLKEFLCIREPDKLAIEAEMQGEQTTIQNKENVFASTLHTLNA